MRSSTRTRGVRNVEVGPLLDTLLVGAVATILVIRLQLWATNYPKLGGGQLHIAHLLWGGLAMLVAIVLLLTFLGRGVHHTAALVGGIGFGFFIDELGKFITARNDYFFKPAAAIIYLVFVALFLATRRLQGGHGLSPRECLANAAELVIEAARGRLDAPRKRLAAALLARADPNDPLVPALAGILERTQCAPDPPQTLPRRMALRAEAAYFRLLEWPGFGTVIACVFIAVALVSVAQAAASLERILAHDQSLEVISAAGLGATVAVGALVWRGLYQLRHSRLAAYLTFEHALLIQIFVAEVFAFLESQFGAAIPLLGYIALTLTLRYLIRMERHMALRGDEPALLASEPGGSQAAAESAPVL